MSLRFRLNLIITVLFLLALTLGVTLVIQNTRRAVQDELQSTADLTLQLLGEIIASSKADEATLFKRVNALENTRHLCVGLHDTNHEFTGDGSSCAVAKLTAAPQWFERLVAPEALEFRRYLSSADAGQVEIVVQADPADEITEAWQEAGDLLVLMVGFWLAANGLVFITLGLGMRPIGAILKGLAGIEQGQYRLRLPGFNLPEFDRISSSFNHMADALEKSTAQNRYLTQRSLDIQEQERRLLARELHDELGQCLSAVQADAVSIAKGSQGLAPQVHESAQAIVSVTSRVFDVLRGMIQQLRPAVLDELGLGLTLGQLIDDWNTRHPRRFCRFESSGDVDLNRLDETVDIHIYRIVQECLTNVERHAQAHALTVDIDASSEHRRLRLRVTDDGRGFEVGEARQGLGLLGMRERADALGGTLHVESAPGKGTRVEVCLPISTLRLETKVQRSA